MSREAIRDLLGIQLKATGALQLQMAATLKVKRTGSKFFAWSPRALRWLPVARAKVQF